MSAAATSPWMQSVVTTGVSRHTSPLHQLTGNQVPQQQQQQQVTPGSVIGLHNRMMPKRSSYPSLFAISRPNHRSSIATTPDSDPALLPGFIRPTWVPRSRSGVASTGEPLVLGTPSLAAQAAAAATLASAALEKQQAVPGVGENGGSLMTSSASGANGSGRSSTTTSGSMTSGMHSSSSGSGVPTSGPDSSPLEITIDTSKARSTAEVVRMCIRELGWKEVCSSRCVLTHPSL